MDSDLLEVIAQASGYFISDLRDATNRPYILRALHRIPWGDHSLEACNYCLSYIFGLQFHFQRHEEILDYLELDK